MALGTNERQRSSTPVQDLDGRLIVVGPDGVPIGGGGGGGAPVSEGTPDGALPTKTLWIAAADGSVLRGLKADASGRLRTVVEGTPAVSVSNFPATQPVSGPLTDAQLRASVVPVSVSNFPGTQPVSGTVTANAGTGPFPVSDNGGSLTVDSAQLPGALDADGGMKVHVQNPSGGGGGGTSQTDETAYAEGSGVFTPVGGVFNDTITSDPTEDQAAAARITPKRAVHSNLRNQAGTEIATASNPVRTDPTGTTTQPVSGTVTANAGTGPFPVSDNGGSLTVDGPLTDVQLRATAVPVSISSAPTINVNSDNIETLADNGAFVDGTSHVYPAGYIFDEVAGTALTENDVVAARVDNKRAAIYVQEDATVRGRRGTITAEGANLNSGDVAHDAVDVGNPVKTGARANFPAIPTLVANGDRTNNWSDLAGAQVIRKRPIASYTALFRLASATAGTRAFSTSALTANTAKQMATIYHAVTATKRVQIKYVAVTFNSLATVAGVIEWELVPLSATTAPATGNPTITPRQHDFGDSAAEATCLSIPTTQGSLAAADGPVGDNYVVNLGITGAGSTSSPPPNATKIVLWDSQRMDDGKDLVMPATTACGFAITVRSTGASAVAFTATMAFTEE